MMNYKKSNDNCNEVSNSIKKNLIANLSTIKNFENQKESYSDEAMYFHDKEMPKVDSNYTYLAVIFFDFVLKKTLKLLSTGVFKRI